MKRQELIDKIQKLLSLATSPNEHEAQIASKKAQELLIKYNLSELDVKKEAQEYKAQSEYIFRKSPELKFIYQILCKHFFVEIVYHGREVVFHGTDENIEVANYIKSFLCEAFKRLYRQAAKENGWRHGTKRNSFYLGLFKGLNDKLTEQKEAMGVGNELMIVNVKLKKHVHGLYDNLRPGKQRGIRADNNAFAQGYEHGRNLNISKGIAATNKSDGTLCLN